MEMPGDAEAPPRHLRMSEPSTWVRRFAPLIPAGGTVLDLACGGGRHARFLLARGHRVVAVDRNLDAVADLKANPAAEVLERDLEDGGPWPFPGRLFAAVVVTNYLHRPLFPHLLAAVQPGGVLLYETFALGNQRFTRPRNPDHLLNAGELLDLVRGRMQVVAFEHGYDGEPCAGVKERLCAVNDLRAGERPEEPPVHPLHPDDDTPGRTCR
jgi:SAM-dependent methyltransferase